MGFHHERDFKTLVENSPDIIARLDREGRYVYVNRAVEAAFGLAAQSFIGKRMQDLDISHPVAQIYEDAIQSVYATGHECETSFSLQADRCTRHYRARLVPESADDGSVESVLVITYDVTQRAQAEFERDAMLIREQAARLQAEAAARVRDQFLSIVSHELRSPLNGIQSWTHVLENRLSDAPPPVQRAITGIKTGVQQQVRLIEDLLDATQVMTGKLRLVKAPMSLPCAVQSAIERAMPQAKQRNITIDATRIPAELSIVANMARLEQVVWHLLSNAIKFSSEGGKVEVSMVANDTEVSLAVSDQGRGITPEFMPFIFNPFRQADGSNTRSADGLGLGLTLVSRLAELHGGRVTAESYGENRGATFTVHLPLTGEAPTVAAAASLPARAVQEGGGAARTFTSLAGVRVLLVDDQQEARDSLAALLEQADARVMALDSGIKAVAFLETVPADERPDVMICDIAMPEQDGYVTLRRIREHEKHHLAPDAKALPAIALTAYAQREDRSHALASGFQVYLAKPAEPSELLAILAMLAGVSGTASNGVIPSA